MTRTWLAMANSVASGLMIAASFGLIYEGLGAGLLRVVSGALIGVIVMAFSRQRLGRRRELELGLLRGTAALKALMIIGVMTLHSVAEGAVATVVTLSLVAMIGFQWFLRG